MNPLFIDREIGRVILQNLEADRQGSCLHSIFGLHLRSHQQGFESSLASGFELNNVYLFLLFRLGRQIRAHTQLSATIPGTDA